MRTITKIACRTVGAIGMGIAIYDAARVGRHYSKCGAEMAQGAYLEKAYYGSRTSDRLSYSSNFARQKTFDMRSKNPLPAFWGKISGGFSGAVSSLANNLLLITASSVALLSKNFFAKVGAIGVGLSLLYNVFRDGYGIGKQNPMN